MADPLTLGLALSGVSAAISGIGAISGGIAQGRAAEFEARQLEQNAKAAKAEASREAAEDHRQKRLAISRARAVGAASGSQRDFDLEGDLEAEGQYQALTSIFQGNQRARGLRTQARARRYDGRAAKRAGFISAGASLTQGGGNTLLAKYG